MSPDTRAETTQAARDTLTRVLVGVDEAGLGPMLGPLAIGWSAIRSPVPERGLWGALRSAVTRHPGRDARHLVVADSKQVFNRTSRGSRRLETTALAFLAAAAEPPRSARALLAGRADLAPDDDLLARHPWYLRLAPELPVYADGDELGRRATRLRETCARKGVAVLSAGVRIVPAGELNASYRQTESKGVTVWQKLAPILVHVWETWGAEAPEVVVDRQGGRSHYAGVLERTFPWCEVHTRAERRGHSEYVVVEPTWTADARGRRMSIVFAERADQSSFCAALASCLAKYGRELCMDAFNAFFGDLQPDLRPTAGYYQDARRWLEEARPALARAALPPDVLVRER